MIYDDAVKLLTSNAKFKINLGLERINETLNRLNNPEKSFKIIHVAGTNGKGSVCALTAEILKSSGYKTGLYTSPHLVEYTERIKINGEDISKEDFAKYIKLVCDVSSDTDLTEFEILTAVAFKYFADRGVEFVLAETGLGGRFDATNAVEEKLLAVITSISLDHIDRLGDTIEKIAFEKAGIIKKNTPVIISKENAGFKNVKKIAKSKNSPVLMPSDIIETFFENGTNYLVLNGKRYEFSLLGDYQKENAGLVFEIIEYLREQGYNIPENAVKSALKNVKWGARLEYIKEKSVLIDGAHNPAAAIELRKYLDTYFRDIPKLFIYATLDTKDYKKIAEILFDENDEIYFYEFNHKNAVSFETYTKNVKRLKNVHKFNPEKLGEIINRKGLKVVTGSLYMTGDLYPELTK